jgi:branched-chain amino acid transport system substrate-binding protein
MLHKKWLRLLVALTVASVIAAACGGDDDDDDDASSDETTEETEPEDGAAAGDRGNVDGELVIGALLPQSGDLSAIYDALSTPVDMAIEEINAAGGVNGTPVVRADADDGTSPDVAATGLDTLLNSDNADVIVGPAASGVAVSLIDTVREAGVVQCSGSNTSAELSTVDDGGFYFRTAPPDALQGPALAQLILSDGFSNVAILARNDSYGTGFADSLEAALTDGGATVALNAAYDPDATDYQADVAAVVDAAPDTVVVIGFNDDGGKVVGEMIAQGVGPDAIQVYTADGMQGSSFYEAVDASNPAVVEGMKGTAPAAAPGGVTHPFIEAYAATGQDTIFSAYYYDCVMLIALAAQSAGTDDPQAIADAMLEVSQGGTLCQAYADCLALLEAGEDIDYDGASGPVDLSDVGEPTIGVYDVWAYDAAGAPANIEGVEQIRIEAA